MSKQSFMDEAVRLIHAYALDERMATETIIGSLSSSTKPMSLQPLKTPEELYHLYVDECHGCHHHKDKHDEYVCRDCITAIKGQGYARDIWMSDTPLCMNFVEMTPANIAEAIEKYYEVYQQHKDIMELYRIFEDQELI